MVFFVFQEFENGIESCEFYSNKYDVRMIPNDSE